MEPEVRRGVGSRLRECRLLAGLTQEEVASALKRTRQTLSKWELGQGALTLDDLHPLGPLLGTSLDYLAYGYHTVPVSRFGVMEKILGRRGVQPAGATWGQPS